MKKCDIAIIGGGPAGMAAAVSAYDNGVKNILIIERDEGLGGILRQCIHNGFGLHRFGEELTGPEYADRYKKMVIEREIPYIVKTMVLGIEQGENGRHTVTAMNSESGVFTIDAGAVVLAMGCRERSRGQLNIPGERPAGVYTAGTAQRFINIKGEMPGKNVVILGSGDIGLIMARRMTLEGANVKVVCELMPYSGGLNRNIVQCLNDFDIPLRLSHTVSKIHGKERVEGVTVSEVDEHLRVIPEKSEYIECDTLLLSCGLLPENELTKSAGIELDRVTGGATVNQNRRTEQTGVYSCGNVLHVHDLVDYVSEEAELAGKSAAEFVKAGCKEPEYVRRLAVIATGGVRYTVPQRVDVTENPDDIKIYFRVGAVMENVRVRVSCGEKELLLQKKRKVAPGEMEFVRIKGEQLKECDGDITVEIVK